MALVLHSPVQLLDAEQTPPNLKAVSQFIHSFISVFTTCVCVVRSPQLLLKMSHKRKSTASDVETQPVTSTANVSASSPETQVVVTAKLSVVVKTLTGKSVSVDVVASSSDSTPTVDDLRNAIVNSADIGIMSEGAPIRMICNGRQLDTCFASLASCNITNGSVVHLIIRLGGNPWYGCAQCLFVC